jgi:AP-1 complex subunit gamma-1
LAGTWVIGEYAEALLRGQGVEEDEEPTRPVQESELVDLLTTILSSSYAGQVVTEYIITAAVKLTTRLSSPSEVARIRTLLNSNQTNLDVEIQQRAVEYSGLFAHGQIMKGVLEKMPPPEIREEQRVLGEAPKKKPAHAAGKRKKPARHMTEDDMLLDLVGGSDGPAPVAARSNGAASGGNNADLLMDILGSGSDAPAAQPGPDAARSNVDAIMGLFGGNAPSPAPAAAAPSSSSADLLSVGGGGGGGSSSAGPAAHEAFRRDGLLITLQLNRAGAGGAVQARAVFRNSGGAALTGVAMQAAVPKSQRLQMQPISAAEIGPGQEASQQLRVLGVNGVSLVSNSIGLADGGQPAPAKLKLRLRISYSTGGPVATHQVDWVEPN